MMQVGNCSEFVNDCDCTEYESAFEEQRDEGVRVVPKQIRNFKKLNLVTKSAYILVAILFVIIPFTGLVLESLNINVISFYMIFALYILTIAVSLLAKQWKLVIVTTIGSMIIWAITLGLSEILWYYMKELFGIDISYR